MVGRLEVLVSREKHRKNVVDTSTAVDIKVRGRTRTTQIPIKTGFARFWRVGSAAINQPGSRLRMGPRYLTLGFWVLDCKFIPVMILLFALGLKDFGKTLEKPPWTDG